MNHVLKDNANHTYRFRGPQPITSLPVYPIKFDASFAALKKDLLARGTRFLELTGSPYAHKMFTGKTTDEPVEEVQAIQCFKRRNI